MTRKVRHLYILTINLSHLLLARSWLSASTATASDLSFYDIFAPQKVPLLKISDDVIASDLWFGHTPVKNSCYAYASSYFPPYRKIAKLKAVAFIVQRFAYYVLK